MNGLIPEPRGGTDGKNKCYWASAKSIKGCHAELVSASQLSGYETLKQVQGDMTSVIANVQVLFGRLSPCSSAVFLELEISKITAPPSPARKS